MKEEELATGRAQWTRGRGRGTVLAINRGELSQPPTPALGAGSARLRAGGIGVY